MATELAFGRGDAPETPVELEFDDGRRILVRGTADRVDRAADGTLVVIDYKTGNPTYYADLNPETRSTTGPALAASDLRDAPRSARTAR